MFMHIEILKFLFASILSQHMLLLIIISIIIINKTSTYIVCWKILWGTWDMGHGGHGGPIGDHHLY